MAKAKGGRPKKLTTLQRRRQAYDGAGMKEADGFKRPGSNNRKKQA